METANNFEDSAPKNFISLQSLTKASQENLRPQLSVPFYFHYFKQSELPPFNKPARDFRPRLLIGTIVKENDVIEIIGKIEVESNKIQCIGDFLVKKKIVENLHLAEKKFVISLFIEVIDYAALRDFSAFKLACLLTIYISMHDYFKSYYWSQPQGIWDYFKEIMIRNTIEDSPDGQEVFTPEECFDIMTHFHTIYLSNLPLIHILTFGSHKLKFVWPYTSK